MGAYQGDDDEGGGGGETHDVGPDTRHVQDAHAPGQALLQQGASLLVQGNLEVTLQQTVHLGQVQCPVQARNQTATWVVTDLQKQLEKM